MSKVVCVQDGVLGHGFETGAVATVVRPAADDSPGVAVPLLHLADAVLGLVPVVPKVVDRCRPFFSGGLASRSERSREEGCEVSFDANGSRARPASAVGLGEGLVQVEVHRVKAHQARRCDAEDGVEVGTVVIHLTACIVDNFAGCLDIRLEQTERVGVGDHHRRRGFVGDSSEGVEVHPTVGEAGDFDNFETGHGSTGRVGAVGGIRDNDLRSLVFATVPEVFLNASNGGELTLCTSDGLERDLVHTSAHLKHVLHLVEDGEQPLQVVFGLMRVDVSNARELGDDFVHTRVVLHGAGTQRIESGVNAKVSL